MHLEESVLRHCCGRSLGEQHLSSPMRPECRSHGYESSMQRCDNASATNRRLDSEAEATEVDE